MKRETIRKNGIRKHCVLTNENGSVMIVALAMLMLLTLIGISATTTSMIEIQIAGVKKTHTNHLFLAEGAAMQCVQTMQNDTNLLLGSTSYLNAKDDTYTDINALQFTNSLTSTISSSGTTGYAAINQGVVGSIKMGQPNLYDYRAYGWHDSPGGRVIVELGYRKAF